MREIPIFGVSPPPFLDCEKCKQRGLCLWPYLSTRIRMTSKDGRISKGMFSLWRGGVSHLKISYVSYESRIINCKLPKNGLSSSQTSLWQFSKECLTFLTRKRNGVHSHLLSSKLFQICTTHWRLVPIFRRNCMKWWRLQVGSLKHFSETPLSMFPSSSHQHNSRHSRRSALPNSMMDIIQGWCKSCSFFWLCTAWLRWSDLTSLPSDLWHRLIHPSQVELFNLLTIGG